jgi:hypothetical protein
MRERRTFLQRIMEIIYKAFDPVDDDGTIVGVKVIGEEEHD